MKKLKYKWLAYFIIMVIIPIFMACNKDTTTDEVEPTENLVIDSLVITKTNIVIWEEIYVTVYARGESLSFQWSTNHGSMLGKDSVSVKYWACPSCIGLNTIKCEVSNEYGTVSDTIMVNVSLEKSVSPKHSHN